MKKAITCDLVNVTPTKAAALLKSTAEIGFKNRNLAPSIVDRYAGDIKREVWFINTGETIKLALKNDVEYVIDGQHRLKAIVQSKTAVKLWIFRYVPEAAFQFIDQGKTRELVDIMTINNNGWAANAKVFSSAGRMLWKEDKAQDAARKPAGEKMQSEGNIAEYLFTTYDHLPSEWGKEKERLQSIQNGGLGGQAWMLYLFMRWDDLDPILANDVFEYLAVKGDIMHGMKLCIKTPNSKIGQELINGNAEPKPPKNVWELAVNYVAEARKESMEIDSSGKKRILKGRNKDLMEATVRAYMLAWNHTRAGKRKISKTGFENTVDKFIEQNGNIIGKAV